MGHDERATGTNINYENAKNNFGKGINEGFSTGVSQNLNFSPDTGLSNKGLGAIQQSISGSNSDSDTPAAVGGNSEPQTSTSSAPSNTNQTFTPGTDLGASKSPNLYKGVLD